MQLGLEGKKAVVLAASKGLGKAAAQTLAAEGCELAICSRDGKAVAQTAGEIEATHGVKVYYRAVDVSDAGALQQFLEEAAENLGGVQILVTNAGGPPVKNFEETNDEEWHYWYDVTFMSVVRSVKHVLPSMKKAGWGRIINITSVAVKAPVENLIYSNALRMAVVGLAKTLSKEVGPHGITVHNVAPGYHLTDGLERIINKKVEQGASRESVLAQWEQNVPVRRIGHPQDLASLITFLASENASYLSGTTIQVDGGMYAGTL